MSKEDNKKNSKAEDQEAKGTVHAIPVSDHFQDWFLDYASYVILERAVPHLHDGLKPVQRRILHALREMDDGRFHKIANVIGQTMQFHPHGDAAIGDALVGMGQKGLMIDTQGNWGDPRTGDSAAAPRYIEGKLSEFALDVAFNKKITDWQVSYDGRKNEPVTLPLKFPLLLAQGVEGIAVGLSTKIMPHNFQEICKAAIKVLEGKPTKLLPDFPNGGIADVTDYKRGKRGGKIRVRCNIEIADKKTLRITDLPYGVTTTSLIDSIVKANDKGKIKIKKVVDNTAAEIEILVDIAPGVSPEVTLDALYAFTNCEVSISPNACVVVDDKPIFTTVDEMLRLSTERTRELLRMELEIRLHELEERWHFASLEKIFIENRIYRDIEECETWEAVIEAIDKGLDPFKPTLNREVTRDDIIRLTEIKIKRISKYDSFQADERLKALEEDIAQVKHHLAHLTEYTIDWFSGLLEKYGEGRERRTELKVFDTIKAKRVAAANARLYVNRTDGFIGTGMRRDEFVTECSDMDDIIVIRKDGRMMVTRVSDKKFVGKDILHVGVWKKGDDRMTYNMIYADVEASRNYAKRFNVTSITRDKEYPLGGKGKTKVHYLTANPNGESEVVLVNLSQGVRARIKNFDFDFSEISVKGRGSKGNIVSKYSIRKVTQKEVGASTLGGRDIWMDDTVGRLNTEERGRWLGQFDTGDKVLVVYKDGSYELTSFELSNRYEMDKIVLLQKWDIEKVFTAIHQDGDSKAWYVKRFSFEGGAPGKTYSFISPSDNSKLGLITGHPQPEVRFNLRKGSSKQEKKMFLEDFIDVKGWKAQGNKLTSESIIGKFHLLTEEPEAQRDAAEGSEGASQASENQDGVAVGGAVEWDLEAGTTDVSEPEEEAPKTKTSKPRKKAPAKKASSRKSKGGSKKDEKDQGELF